MRGVIEYGVAWRTERSKNPTSVFFPTRKARFHFVEELKRNSKVLANTITYYISNEVDKVLPDKGDS